MSDQSASWVEGELASHWPLLGRVAMALVGDPTRVEQVLEQVARDAVTGNPPQPSEARVWLLGLVRGAAATQLSRLPLRVRPRDDAPATERLGAAAAAPARAALASLKPTEREAVILALVANLEAKDIALACNTDPETARARLGRGLEQLMLRMADEDGGPR